MAVSKKQQQSVTKYVKNHYDRINVTFPKGDGDRLKAHAESQNESVNGFIKRAVYETIERDLAKKEAPPDGETSQLHK